MKLFFDENFSPPMVRGLAILEEGRKDDNQVIYLPDAFGRGAKDEDWIPNIASEYGIVVTQDVNIRRRYQQWQLCKAHKLSLLFVIPSGRKGYLYWDFVKWFVKDWEVIIRELKKGKKGTCWEIRPRNKVKKL